MVGVPDSGVTKAADFHFASIDVINLLKTMR